MPTPSRPLVALAYLVHDGSSTDCVPLPRPAAPNRRGTKEGLGGIGSSAPEQWVRLLSAFPPAAAATGCARPREHEASSAREVRTSHGRWLVRTVRGRSSA